MGVWVCDIERALKVFKKVYPYDLVKSIEHNFCGNIIITDSSDDRFAFVHQTGKLFAIPSDWRKREPWKEIGSEDENEDDIDDADVAARESLGSNWW